MKVLITSGGTKEPIDGVRSITNFSTGKTGSFIANYFASQGDEVVFCHSKDSMVPTENSVVKKSFETFDQLDSLLKENLKQDFDAVIHLAAVSDFSVDHIVIDGEIYAKGTKKIPSGKNVSISLRPNKKIINEIKSYAIKRPLLVGFKLTNNATSDQVKLATDKLFEESGADVVVQNDLSKITEEYHLSNIYYERDKFVKCNFKECLAQDLRILLERRMNK